MVYTNHTNCYAGSTILHYYQKTFTLGRIMKKIILIIVVLVAFSNAIQAQMNQRASPYTIELVRTFSKELFDLNGVPYLAPMVETVNATSNARFYSSAYVPRKVNKPYFKISVNGMLGFVNDEQRTYRPELPMDTFAIDRLNAYGNYDIIKLTFNIKDTAGLINYLFKTVLYDANKNQEIVPPDQASTILGADTTQLHLDNTALQNAMKRHPIYAFLPKDMQDSLIAVVKGIPNFYTLPAGGDLNTILAGVPQFEIGSLYGTELLLRFIPPVDMGKYIGEFAFWGVGLKHSISQYFYEDFENDIDDESNGRSQTNPAPFNLAAQFVYQGTYLKNKVGLTSSNLEALANIFSFNLLFSKSFEGIFDVYSGIAYNRISIKSDFTYYLPVETQLGLGLLRGAVDPNDPTKITIMPPEPPEYPGDTEPQTTSISLEDSTFKWTVGLRKNFGPISIFFDYSISKFNIFSGGVEYAF